MCRAYLIFLCIIVVSCTSSSGVVPINDGAFLISRSEKGFDVTGSAVKADAIKEANKFCAQRGKKILITKIEQKDMVPFKSDAQAEIEFMCQ